MPKLTHSRLLEVLHYDPMTGVFTWLESTARRIKIGDIAGTVHSKGYLVITISGERIFAQSLAWFYVHDYWPTNLVDHRDRDKLNNRILNLRECNYSLNAKNSSIHKDNLCGFKGVSRMRSKFRARIRTKSLGIYATAREAAEAYDLAINKYRDAFDVTNKDLGLLP